MNNIEIIKKLSDAVVNFDINQEEHPGKRWTMNIDAWDWIPGVGLYGLYKAFLKTGDQKLYDFLIDWTDKHIAKPSELKTVNSTAPLLTIFELYKHNKNEKYLKVCKDIANWVISSAPKTAESGFEHTVTEKGANFSQQIWADTLFMVCIFLANIGKELENEAYQNEAINQLFVHHKVLKDINTGLFYHGWNCNDKNWMSGALWGRANAWITLSTVEILSALPESFEGKDFIIKSLNEQVCALSKYQRENGMFGTLLDAAESYDEASATAGIAYGIKKGIEKGYVSSEYFEIYNKAITGITEYIDKNGEVMGVSSGTPVMPTKEDYKSIDVYPALYGLY